MTRIIRVFPRKTSMTPTDDLAFIGNPLLPMFQPEADEVHVSVTFTWDIEEGERLRKAWSNYYDVVRLGGPAFGYAGEFTPGVYVKPGVTFTSRGCPNRCPWCLVPKHEGGLRLLDIKPGNIVQDNNLLACPRSHQSKVFDMLKAQRRAASFPGGLDTRRLDPWFVEQLRGIKVKQVFLAADTKESLRSLERALDRLRWLPMYKRRVYTMIAYNDESLDDAEARLEAVWHMGGVPFAQLYQPLDDNKIKYSLEWKKLQRSWSRPAATAAMHGGWPK